MRMKNVPSLVSLCVDGIKKELVHGDDLVPYIHELPSELFENVVAHLPPLALEKLQTEMSYLNDHESTDDCFRNGRKRGRNGLFNTAWRALFKQRWPELVGPNQPVDWQQLYWEAHLQNCLDEAAEIASLPSFGGDIGQINVPDTILKNIGYERHMGYLTSDYSKLLYNCQHFADYARILRLQNVLCTSEICDILRNCKLQGLVLRWIRSKDHVDSLCKLLNQNSETLTSIEFVHCKFSSSFVDIICGSLFMKSSSTHGIQHFSISTSSFLQTNPSLPAGLVSFLSSGRSLRSLKFCDNHLGRNFANMVLGTLLDVSSNLSSLDLSDNNIVGWPSNFNRRSSGVPSSIRIGKSLQALRLLNLRGNNLRKDDAGNLRYALVHMPNLEILDISDNPIEDEGIRSLVAYFVEASERFFSLSDLNLENCELSCSGVTHLLNTLSTLKKPLKSLSVADNRLGSQIAAAVGKFLGTPVQVLNIGGIGLGSSGFHELREGISEELKLVNIDISKNRGGIETAKFLSKLMSCAPQLVMVNAAYNLMPVESSNIICPALKVFKGNLECFDLRGNTWDCQPAHASILTKFQTNGRSILILPSSPVFGVPYDDEP